MSHRSRVKIRILRFLRKRGIPLSTIAGVLAIFVLYQNCGSASTGRSSDATTAVSPTPTATPIVNSLILNPSFTSVRLGGTVGFNAYGGSGTGFTYSMVSGTGTISSTGTFTAPNVAETDQVQVTDSVGDTANGWINVQNIGGGTTTSTTANVTYYGLDATGTTITKTYSAGTYDCTNAAFGSDPDVNHVKGCYVNSALVMTESGSFIVSSTGTVTPSYSSNIALVSFSANDGTGTTINSGFGPGMFYCTNTTFGMDPDFGHVKSCKMNGVTLVPEGGAFYVSMSGNVSVASNLTYGTGNFSAVSQAGGYQCTGLSGASSTNGTAVIAYQCLSGHNDQRWRLVPAGTGPNTFNIVNLLTGKCWDVTGASTSNGALVQEWDCSGVSQQIFKLQPYGTGYQVKPQHDSMCIGTSGGHSGNGTNIIQWSCDLSANQTWTFQ